MSHRKVHSRGSIPFSWEDKPGVSKVTNQDCPTNFGFRAVTNQDCPTDIGFHTLTCFSDEDSGDIPKKPQVLDGHEIKIPLPPCPILKAPSRSASSKGLRWQVETDPFLLAYKECTKSTSTLNNAPSGKLPSQNNKKGFGLIGYKVRKSKFNMFSCKSSGDVRDDKFVKLSQLPRLPRDRSLSSR